MRLFILSCYLLVSKQSSLPHSFAQKIVIILSFSLAFFLLCNTTLPSPLLVNQGVVVKFKAKVKSSSALIVGEIFFDEYVYGAVFGVGQIIIGALFSVLPITTGAAYDVAPIVTGAVFCSTQYSQWFYTTINRGG